jgi:Ner family transcriptional regulator
MHPEDIKAALRKHGSSQAKVARKLNVAITSVHNVIHGACKSERIAKAIADIIGIDRAELWPGRYEPIHERLAKAA